jgi:hypothetical protein
LDIDRHFADGTFVDRAAEGGDHEGSIAGERRCVLRYTTEKCTPLPASTPSVLPCA